MANVRDLTRILTAHLGIDVVPHAARLVRAGYLPRRDDDADEHEAADLLAAVIAAPTATEAVENR